MIESQAYVPRRMSRSRMIDIRGLACHIREWGEAGAPTVFLLHGHRDASATFQFMVDELRGDYHFIAPDWRGHGQSGWAPQGYTFPDYIGDLDFLLEALSPGEPATIIGHSLGGNVACTYAGVRPERVRRVLSLDSAGLPDPDPDDTPKRLAKWLKDWREGPEPSRAYDSVEAIAARLVGAHPRLTPDKALFLAANTTRRGTAGEWLFAFDPRHRSPFAVVARRAEWKACMRRVEAPVFWLLADRPGRFDNDPDNLEARLALFRNIRHAMIPNTSHNIHHDAPAEVARYVDSFLSEV